MKNFKFVFLFAAFLAAGLTFSACGNKAHDHSGHNHDAMETDAKHGEGKEFTSAYVCPMHCESGGSEEAGKCPVCGMDYVAQAEHAKDGHTH